MQCEEGLCEECLDHHKRIKMSRNHTTIDAKQHAKLPSFILSVKPDCVEHKLQLELYCPTHKVAGCVKCIEKTHKACTGITSLGSVTENVKSSSEFHEIERGIVAILEDLEKVTRSRTNNLNRLNEQDVRIKSEISTLRSMINEHIDRLEEKMSNDLQTSKSKETLKIETVLSEINDRRENLLSLQKDMKGMQLHATDLQAFYGLRHVESELEKNKGYIHYLQTSESVLDVDISFETSPSLTLITGRVSSLGKINIAMSPLKSTFHPAVRAKSMTTTPTAREIPFKSGKTSLSQIPEAVKQEIDVRKISLLYQRNINIPVGPMGIISSIIKLSDRKILVVESSYNNGHLFLFNNVGKYIRDLKIKGGPWDVTQLDEGTIAVTYPEENSLKFINLVTDQVIDTIPLNTSGCGLGSDNDAIYVGLKGNELRALDYYGNKIGSVTIKSRLENSHMTPDKIYYTDPKKHSLSCVSPSGQFLWTYTNEYMRGPQCVTTDKHENIYIGCNDTHCILVISPDRNKIKILIGKSVGLERPHAMFCDKENSILLVSNRNGKFAASYKIGYR